MAASPGGPDGGFDVRFDLGLDPDRPLADLLQLEYAGELGELRFAIHPDGRRIWADWSPDTTVRSIDDVAALLLGVVLGGVLRLRGRVSLHGCVVDLGARAVAILGDAAAGKSTLAAVLAREGHGVLSDDVVALNEPRPGEWIGEPGYAGLRVGPASLAALGPSASAHANVMTGIDKRYVRLSLDGAAAAWRFAATPRRLSAIYVLKRDGAALGPTVEDLPPAERLATLIAHARTTPAPLPRDARRRELAALGRLAETVPVRLVRAPEGLDTVPATGAAILADAA